MTLITDFRTIERTDFDRPVDPAPAAEQATDERPPLADPATVDGDGFVLGERQLLARQLLRPFWCAGALLMMLDGLTTYIALTYFAEDGAREGNPLGVWVIDQIGVAGMCTAKVLIGVLMMWRLAIAAERGHRWSLLNRSILLRERPMWIVRRNAAWALAFSVVLMGVVVGNNLRAIVSLAMQ